MRTIVITGVPASGKTFLSRNIAYGFENPVWMNGRERMDNNPFQFQSVNRDTDLIIWDDVIEKNINRVLSYAYEDSLKVEKQLQAPFYIDRPVFIINVDFNLLDIEKYFIDRPAMHAQCEFIICQKRNDIFHFLKVPASTFQKSLEDVS